MIKYWWSIWHNVFVLIFHPLRSSTNTWLIGFCVSSELKQTLGQEPLWLENAVQSQGSEWSIQRLKLTLMKCLLSRFTPILLELFNREVTAWEGQSGCESGSVYQELMWSGPGQWQSIILTLCASDRQDSGHVRTIVFMWWVHMNTTQLLWNSWFYLALFTLLWFVFHI